MQKIYSRNLQGKATNMRYGAAKLVPNKQEPWRLPIPTQIPHITIITRSGLQLRYLHPTVTPACQVMIVHRAESRSGSWL